MNASATVVSLGLSLLAAGCMTTSIEHTDQLPEPATIPVEGAYRHVASGMEFPERIGSLRRSEVVHYDVDGRNVSAGYASPPGAFPVIATVYVYPGRQVSSFLAYGRTVTEYSQRLAKQDFQAERDGVLNHYRGDQGAAVVSEGEVTLSLGGADRRGWRAEFSAEGALGVPGMPCVSLLYWFPSVDGKWNVKFRITHWHGPEDPDEAIEAVLEGAPWPGAAR